MSKPYRAKYHCDNGGHGFIVDDCPWCRIAKLEELVKSAYDEGWDDGRCNGVHAGTKEYQYDWNASLTKKALQEVSDE